MYTLSQNDLSDWTGGQELHAWKVLLVQTKLGSHLSMIFAKAAAAAAATAAARKA